MKFSIYQRTEQAGRRTNEDRMGYCHTKEAALFVVADGMGGHAHGELAAQMALETLVEAFKVQAQPRLADPRHFLSTALLRAHHQILSFSHEHGMADSPRTTLVACVIQDGKTWWTHCGDSRLYLFRGGAKQIRTLDHSYIEQMPLGMNLGAKRTAEQLAKMANRNVLFTCLGAPTKPIYDVAGPIALTHADQFLLCTDGLWSQFDDDEIVKIFSASGISDSTSLLIDLALKRAGRFADNVTALAFEWLGQDAPSAPDHGFTSSVNSHLIDVDALQISDLDIEASLKEINSAIAKSIRMQQ